jgi:hypothetical protein
MPVTVSRIYDSPEKAETAASELKKYSFAPEHINVVTPNGHDAEGTVSALTKGGISSARAKVYAEAVSGGKSVVTVLPTFGKAAKAAEILDTFGPVETHITDVPDTVERGPKAPRGSASSTDSAAPLSSAAGWKVLSDDPTPLSSKFGWRVLLDNPTPLSSWLGWRTLSDNQTSRTALSHDPAPLSNLLGWKLLSDNPAPLSSRAGWRIISDEPAPLSKKFGWRVLSENQTAKASISHNPTPLSSLLGLPVLTGESSSRDNASAP